jgi:hypothetical protein
MKILKVIVSCLMGCAASTLPAQIFLGTIYQGFSSTIEIPVTIRTSGTLSKVLVVTSGAANLDFTYTGSGSCAVGSPVTAGTQCTVGVKFTPTMVGARYGGLLLMNQDGSIANGTYLFGKGTGPQMSFSPGTQSVVGTGYYAPQGLAVDEQGNVYAAEGASSQEQDAQPAQGGLLKNSVSYGAAAWSSAPNGIAVDGGGLIYTSTPSGSYRVIPPAMTQAGAPFNGHAAVDMWGNLYTACAAGLCKETLQIDGSYLESTLASGLTPSGIAVDGNGNVLVVAGALYKFAPAGTSYTQTVIRPASLGAVSIAVDGPGNLYVGDSAGNIYKQTLNHNGTYTQSTLIAGGVYPGSLAADGRGDVYFFKAAGTSGNTTYSILKADYASTPTMTFADTVKGALNSDGIKTLTITNSGDLSLQFSAITFPEDFVEAFHGTSECTSSTTLQPNASCTLKVRFAPTAELEEGDAASLQESIVITSNSGNQPGTQQNISLVGKELAHVAAPTLSLPGGVYYTTQTVTATTTTPGAVMYYTLNGTTPTTASRRVTGPIGVNAAETLNVIAVVPGVETSPVTSAYYALTAPTPVIAPAGDPVNGVQMVTITTATPIEAIFYTTAGNKPTTSSAHYTGPIAVTGTKYVWAFAAQTGFISSPFVKMQFNVQPASSQK